MFLQYNAIIVHIKVMVVGGLTNNILAPQYVEKQHAEKVIHYFFLSANVDSAISAGVCTAHCSVLSGYIGHGSFLTSPYICLVFFPSPVAVGIQCDQLLEYTNLMSSVPP